MTRPKRAGWRPSPDIRRDPTQSKWIEEETIPPLKKAWGKYRKKVLALIIKAGERTNIIGSTPGISLTEIMRNLPILGESFIDDGTEITAPVVVSNLNAKTLYRELVGEEHLHPLARFGIKSYEPSISAAMVCLGVDYEPPLDAHHTMITAPYEEMNDYWWNRLDKGLLPKEQFGLVCWATKSDHSLAPEGCHAINVIFMAPSSLPGSDWDKEKERFLEDSIAYLARKAVPGLSDHVKVAELITPFDYERRLLHPGGAIYGLQEDLVAQTVFRPRSKSKSIGGLYLAGASTHPGGGVPLVIGSGIIASDLVSKYE